MLINIGPDFIHRGFHFSQLFSVILDTRCIQTAVKAVFVPHPSGGLNVLDDREIILAAHLGDGLELFRIGVVETELETVQPRSHAGSDSIGSRQAAIRRQKHVGKSAVLFGIADGFRKPWAQERFPEIEYAQLFNSGVPQFGYDAAIERLIDVRLAAQFLGRGAKRSS